MKRGTKTSTKASLVFSTELDRVGVLCADRPSKRMIPVGLTAARISFALRFPAGKKSSHQDGQHSFRLLLTLATLNAPQLRLNGR